MIAAVVDDQLTNDVARVNVNDVAIIILQKHDKFSLIVVVEDVVVDTHTVTQGEQAVCSDRKMDCRGCFKDHIRMDTFPLSRLERQRFGAVEVETLVVVVVGRHGCDVVQWNK